MGRPKDVAEQIRAGLTPAEIARVYGVTVETIVQYLHRAVGEGFIRRSDIYFSIEPKRRRSDPSLKLWYSKPACALGDMYEDLRIIETTLHKKIKHALIRSFGNRQSGWWRQGIPEKIRLKCRGRREADPDEPSPLYSYTDLLDLLEILEHHWALLQDLLQGYTADRRRLGQDLRRLNRIRNKVMHPVRGSIPCEADFDFVRQLMRSICGK